MWEESNNKLRKEFKFKDFIEAAAFITKVSIVSEKNNHHPEIYNIYNKVIIDLCTHDKENQITSKDYNLAKEIDKIL
ncbi:MAG: 4a-hydroxytetrahydrobiopterin dehydratase [Cytophagales bacterium]|nr:MAG: pterin-4-alpha-carbinolamine dehydratase [Rhodothermaeota bacterium MED-G16]|tara:strand:+ start:206 stop:436 length:231 start_codon:yes stop_codon:yes gene_type:complete